MGTLRRLSIGSTLINDGHHRADGGAGNGGRTITGNVTNDGTVNVNVNTSYSTGTWDNAGAIDLADGRTLTVATSPATFTDDTGARCQQWTSSYRPAVVDGDNTYNQGNGTTSGEPVLLAGPATGSPIALHYTGNGASSVRRRRRGHVDGAIVAGQTLSIDGTCSNNATETVDASETNAGTVHLSSSGCGNSASLVVTPGDTFTNQSSGIIDIDNGAGNGGRTITGNVTNDGTVNVNVEYELQLGDVGQRRRARPG